MEKTLYSQEEILKDHIFIHELFFEGKAIAICVTKKENKYSFFIQNENGYEIATGEYYNKLANELLPKDDGVFRLESSGSGTYDSIRRTSGATTIINKYGRIKIYFNFKDCHKLVKKEDREELEDATVQCINFAVAKLQNLGIDEELIKQACENLNEIVINFTTDNLGENVGGQYYLNHHAIVIPVQSLANNYFFIKNVMVHELFHAMSAYQNFTGVSYSSYYKKTGQVIDQKGKRLLLRGFNELITEGLVGKYNNNEYLGYAQAMKQFSILFQDCPPKELFGHYFQNNQLGLVRLFQNEFGMSMDAVIRYLSREDMYLDDTTREMFETGFPNLGYNLLADSTLFAVNRVWNKSRDIKISDFEKMAKASNISVENIICYFCQGLARAHYSYFQNTDVQAIIKNVFSKLNKVQLNSVAQSLVILKLESDFFDGRIPEVNQDVLNAMLKTLGLNISLNSSREVLRAFPGAVTRFISKVLEKEYGNKERQLFKLAFLYPDLTQGLAKACLLKSFKKDKNYTGVAKIFEAITPEERNLYFSQIVRDLSQDKPNKSVGCFDPKTLKILIEKFGNKTITDKPTACNLFYNLIEYDNCLTQLSWKEISNLFTYFETDQDILIKELYFNSIGKEITLANDFNSYSPEDQEAIWGEVRKKIDLKNRKKTEQKNIKE